MYNFTHEKKIEKTWFAYGTVRIFEIFYYIDKYNFSQDHVNQRLDDEASYLRQGRVCCRWPVE